MDDYEKDVYHCYRVQSLYGWGVFRRKMDLVLRKEPDKEYDKEAIRVEIPGIGKVGETLSAGRLCDKIGKKARAKVELITERGAVARRQRLWGCEIIAP